MTRSSAPSVARRKKAVAELPSTPPVEQLGRTRVTTPRELALSILAQIDEGTRRFNHRATSMDFLVTIIDAAQERLDKMNDDIGRELHEGRGV